MKLKTLKTYEMIQRAELGGHPTPNGEMFEHGDTVYVVSKRELLSLFYEILPTVHDRRLQRLISKILREDSYIARDGGLTDADLPDDLPTLPA